MIIDELAIRGGPKVRVEPLPYRGLFNEEVLEEVVNVFRDSWEAGVDFGYQGTYEDIYTNKFCEFQGGGYADAVCTGTVAVYLALLVLDIPPGADVIVSPVTDPGSVAPVVLQRLRPVVADSQPGTYNVGPDEFEDALTPSTRAAILTHAGGNPLDMAPIMEIARSKGILVVEDCSQAHGALYWDRKVGTFGDIAAFSTMYSKNHATGGCGGIVYTTNEDYYWSVRSHADRGKPFRTRGPNPKDPTEFLFPALNYNLDEVSCAIGTHTLSCLPTTIAARRAVASTIDTILRMQSSVVYPCNGLPGCTPSPFFHTVGVDTDKISVSKREFAEAISAEGIWINPNYKYVVSEWEWMEEFPGCTPNAIAHRNSTFNILFNEQFTGKEVDDIITSILKVESHYTK